VVNLRDDDGAEGLGRGELIRHYGGMARRFFDHLREEMNRRQLDGPILAVDDQSPLPVVTLTCSSDVAELIGNLPEVLDVYRDEDPSRWSGIASNPSLPVTATCEPGDEVTAPRPQSRDKGA
jgi:hypothetical protein